jgi:hypothetical protein
MQCTTKSRGLAEPYAVASNDPVYCCIYYHHFRSGGVFYIFNIFKRSQLQQDQVMIVTFNE